MKYLIFILLLISCVEKKEVFIYKQMNLDPNVNTLDITASKLLSQSLNYVSIYEDIEKKINSTRFDYTVISKKCEKNANGWNLSSLKKRVPFSNYRYILAPLGLKLKARFTSRVHIICSDNKEVDKVIKGVKGKVILAMKEKEALKLKRRLLSKNIKALLFSSYGFIHKSLREVIFAGVPFDFNYKKYPIENLLPLNSLMSLEEKESLEEIMSEAGVDFRLLLSDFDKDGYRDFTVSSSDKFIIINNEDRDWDNDGVQNIRDAHVKKTKIGRSIKIEFEDFYEKEVDIPELIKKLDLHYIKLVTLDKGLKHNISILELLLKLLDNIDRKKYRINHFVVKKPKFKYGKEVFFSYNEKTLSMEYYPVEFKKYLLKKRAKSKVDDKSFYFGFIKGILVHSLSHELIHSRKFKLISIANDNDWSIKMEAVNSIYLQQHRHKFNSLESSIKEAKYKNRDHKSWLLLHKKYINTVNQLLASKGDFMEKVKVTPWYTYSESKRLGEQMSFLNYHNIPSLYGTYSPSEWLAEMLSMCLFNKIFPKIPDKAYVTARYELTWGINPRAVNKKFCLKFKL